MIAIIGTNELKSPEDIESAILPNGRVLIAKDADEFRRTGLESLLDNYRSQNRGGKGKTGMSTRDEDFVKEIHLATTHTKLLVFSFLI